MTAVGIVSERLAGLQSQALGLAEAVGLPVSMHAFDPRWPWRMAAPCLWPWPLRAAGIAAQDLPGALITCGGAGAAVGAALRRAGRQVVQVQNPRLDPRRFDLIVANRHDELSGSNVIVTRTALHRVTPARLADAAAAWRDRLAHLPRPLVAVLVGGSNGRFRLDADGGARLAGQLAAMMRRDRVGVALTPSRRTDPAVCAVLRDCLSPLGGWLWDGRGDNPYFGLLALADMIVATIDSVSMVSEAVATSAPVLLASLPGRSRRIGLFVRGLLDDGRVRMFDGRFQHWDATPLDDTGWAAATMIRRMGWGAADSAGSAAATRDRP